MFDAFARTNSVYMNELRSSAKHGIFPTRSRIKLDKISHEREKTGQRNGIELRRFSFEN